MMSATGASLQPTYEGHVATTQDALALFEACLSGQLHHVPRRPHDRERSSLIRSGCVFIYEENASGIKRWTDGVPWSPSRILGNFLVYRELLKPFPPGEKKRATKRTKRTSKPGEPYPKPEGGDASPSSVSQYSPASPTPLGGFKTTEQVDRETERSLIGSLVDSYGFKDGGLVKKTMSVNVNGVHHHLVSYYKVEDVMNRVLEAPSQNPSLRYIKPRHELTSRQNFRAPLDELEDSLDSANGQYRYGDRNSLDRRQLMTGPYHPGQGTPTQPTFGYPGVDPGYGAGPSPHPAASAGYAGPTPASAPHPSYYHPPNSAGLVQPKNEEYSPYGPPPGMYGSRFESLNSATSPMQAHTPDRGPPQLNPMGYPQQPLRTRPPNGAQTPSAIDTKSPNEEYNRAYYSGPGRTEHVQSPYHTTEAPRWTPTSTAVRPDNIPAYTPNKAPEYWPVSAGSVGPGHGHYPTPSSAANWHPTV